MAEKLLVEAVNDALHVEMERDASVMVMGEDDAETTPSDPGAAEASEDRDEEAIPESPEEGQTPGNADEAP